MLLMNLERLKKILMDEAKERFEEGFKLDLGDFAERVGEAESIEKLYTLYEELKKLKPRVSFDYVEPSEKEELWRERPGRFDKFEVKVDERTWSSVLGGWLGRSIGCMLGKPVEGWSRKQIKSTLTRIGEYPLEKPYFPMDTFSDVEEKKRSYVKNLTRDNIVKAERDDDLDYTILNLLVCEEHDLSFTSSDVAEAWLTKLPYNLTYTAERAAYRNLTLGFKPPETATYLNPYREWIGAQIRADLWGYISPGDPEQAMNYAFRDARISHTKNGIYGELYVASLVSLAYINHEPVSLVEEGLKAIPSRSRLAEAIKFTIELYRKGLEWEEAIEKILIRYGHYHFVHTINNAALVVAAILWGESDFTKTIFYAVLSGLDTDCNGATTGSILGVMLGVEGIPEEWSKPLNDKLVTAISGLSTLRISQLADRTLKLITSTQGVPI